ncbi:MAG: SpoIID/LytB domain-containing protein [Candidatus Omnitrophica bacterium]|nr:SpoIID/LytB domain-containing protein [Candidatus Omnitrophota bacterium]
MAYKDVYVRVAIMQNESSFDLDISGSYQIVDAKNNSRLYRGRNLKTKVVVAPGGFYIGELNFKENKIIIRPRHPDSIRINGRRFRGDIILVNKKSGILAINILNLEDYLKGVLYHEISHYWPMEAIKAQAVVSRTFALYQTIANKDKEFDLTCDIYSQVYGGRTSERWRTVKAVDKTRGLVIKYEGKILPAYFHATCGGMTEDVANLWNMDLPPLKGVVCGFCQKSPHINWHYDLALDELRSILNNKAGYKINLIKDIIVRERSKSGRIMKLEIITDDKKINISAKDFRNLIGPHVIRSTNFQIEIKDGTVKFQGIGWGHGVGMCQWGAYFMAKKGAHYDEIIKYYYPGVKIGDVD